MDLGLNGRVAVITGASEGIGRAVARQLAEEGAHVVVAARRKHELDLCVTELTEAGHKAVGVAGDATESTFGAELHDTALREFGRVDIAVCCAGGGFGPVKRFDWTEWAQVYQLNVLSAMGLAHTCVGTMRKQGWGRVVMLGSTAGRDADPRFAAYGGAKAALHHAAKSMALAYAKDGVMVNCVQPGLTRSEGVMRGYQAQAERLGTTAEAVEQRMMELQPIATGRAGESEEVAAAITFLCSERASWITGAQLLVDGGTVRVIP